jgi:tRNA uridine 5-carbamoylmethylation protein Kti12
MATIFFLVGLPGSGKTYIASSFGQDFVRVSSDDYIEAKAASSNSTYSEIFAATIKEADSFCFQTFLTAISQNKNIIVDRTNISRKSRERFLKELPENYKKFACVVKCKNEKEWRNRLASRDGKHIPQNVLESMKKSFEFPSTAEGFDDCFVVET